MTGEEIERRDSPNVTSKTWGNLLSQTGFSGLDIELGDTEEENATVSVVMSTAIENLQSRIQASIIYSPGSLLSPSSLAEFRQRLEDHTGFATDIVPVESVTAVLDY